MADLAADRNLLFGLLALQNGLVDQLQLVAGFQAWIRNKSRPLADHLVARGDLDDAQRDVVAALADLHVRKHGGSTEESLAAITPGRTTRESLAQLGDGDVDATLAYVGSGSAETGSGIDPNANANNAVGTTTSNGQRFRVLRPHAQGGLGAVFVALDAELDREVALKQILDDQADDPACRRRFLQEAKVTGGLEHPGIVPVYGLGNHADGRPYYAMRFIRGDSLKEAIAAFHADLELKSDPGRRSLELRKLLQQFVDVCNAIEYAHSRGVLHRDIKPSNIIVGRYGETLMLDWGMAKATGRVEPESASGERMLDPSSGIGSVETFPGSALGTPAYMSPEQAEGDLERLGPRSDVYSLGATLYCILTGRPPFEGDIGAVILAVRKGDFRPPRQLDPAVDPAMQAISMKAMAHGPADRYATPRSLAEDIERWMADQPVSCWREPLARRARRWARRNRTAVTAAAAAILAGDGRTGGRPGGTGPTQFRPAGQESRARHRQYACRPSLRRPGRGESAGPGALRPGDGGDQDLSYRGQRGCPAQAERARGAADQAVARAREFYRKLETQLRGQTDPRALEALGGAYDEIGRLSDKIGSKEEALEDLRRGLALRERLAGDDPRPGARADLGRTLRAIGSLLAQAGRHSEAIESYGRARAIFAELAREGPGADVQAGPRALRPGHRPYRVSVRETGRGTPCSRAGECGPRGPATGRAIHARKPGRAGSHAQLDLSCPAANRPNFRGNHDLPALDRYSRGRRPVRSHHRIPRRSRHLPGQSRPDLPPARLLATGAKWFQHRGGLIHQEDKASRIRPANLLSVGHGKGSFALSGGQVLEPSRHAGGIEEAIFTGAAHPPFAHQYS